VRHPFVATREESVLLIVDIQQAMLKVIPGWEEVGRKAMQLVRAAGVVQVPIAVTEHYKKGLGGTIPELAQELGAATFVEKEFFSSCLEPNFLATIRALERTKIVLVGMETHVCVLQTGLDLIQAGYQVQLVEDAVGSRSERDRITAVDLFRAAGAVVTSTEAVIFQWARRSNTDEFRKILPIVK
jgi:nicotinamidase-related amidase